MVGLARRCGRAGSRAGVRRKTAAGDRPRLASSPSLLLLDEPLAGMSPRERKETVQLLKNIRRGRTLVVVEHDMDAMFELAERITVLHEGVLLAEGTPAEFNATVPYRKPTSVG